MAKIMLFLALAVLGLVVTATNTGCEPGMTSKIDQFDDLNASTLPPVANGLTQPSFTDTNGDILYTNFAVLNTTGTLLEQQVPSKPNVLGNYILDNGQAQMTPSNGFEAFTLISARGACIIFGTPDVFVPTPIDCTITFSCERQDGTVDSKDITYNTTAGEFGQTYFADFSQPEPDGQFTYLSLCNVTVTAPITAVISDILIDDVTYIPECPQTSSARMFARRRSPFYFNNGAFRQV